MTSPPVMWHLLAALLPLGLADEGCGPGPYALSPPFDQRHSEDVCKTCVSANCRWCPFSQSCAHPSSWFSGRDSACMNKKDFKPVESGNGCGAPPTEWMTLLESNYGKGLAASGSNADLMRCLQNRVERWQMWPDPDKRADWGDKELSDFSCTSALIREAVVASLSSESSFMNFMVNNSAQQVVKARALSEGWEATERETNFCAVYKQFFPKEYCEVKTYGEYDFSQLRKAYSSYARDVPSDYSNDLKDSLQRGPLRPSDLDKDELFLTTWDFKYSLLMNFKEKSNLEKMVRGDKEAKPLKDHLRSNPYSLLQRVFSLVQIKILKTDVFVLVLANENHGLERKISPEKVPADGAVQRYDLKGKSRKQTKKSKHPYVGINGDFAEQKQNELPLRNWQCKNFLKYLQPDLNWLESHALTEYSFFVEVAGGSIGCSGLPKVPLCNACLEDTTTLAIVDYFKDKSFTSTSPKKFSTQMMDFAQQVCLTDKKEGMESWQVFLIVACVVVLLLCGAFLGWKYGAGFMRSDRPHELRDTPQSMEMTQQNLHGGAQRVQAPPAGWNPQFPPGSYQGAPPSFNNGGVPGYYNQGAPQNFA
eukprot:s144_g5.t1